MLSKIFIFIYVVFNGMLACYVLSETIEDFYYETWGFRIFYEQIKNVLIYNPHSIPCPIIKFKYMTIIGRFIFGFLWVLVIPGHLAGFIISFIIWSIYWIGVKVCFKNMEE